MTSPDNVVLDLAHANRILVNEGVLDGFGHASVRHPEQHDRFLIARSMAPGLVTPADILVCDLDGQVQDAQGRKTYVERFIHSEIYRARPDVMAVVHSHSPSVIPFGVTGVRFRPICHMSGFLGATVPVFEIRHSAGEDSDMLVRNQAHGRALAQSLSGHAVALMRGHGCVVVGTSIQQAVYRAVYTERNAELQHKAMQLGAVTYLTDGEAQATSLSNDEHLGRPWEIWKQRAGLA